MLIYASGNVDLSTIGLAGVSKFRDIGSS